MGRRAFAAVVTFILVAIALSGLVGRGDAPASSATLPSSPLTSASDSPNVSPGATSPYTFEDEFDGPTLDPAWQRHFSCCGTLAGFDPSLTTIANGILSIAVEHRPDGWYGDLIDTKSTFSQRYGTFAARIRIPSGAGLWPAFWGYFAGNGGQAEIDTMEVCGDAAGRGGSILHNSVYWSHGKSISHPAATVDLSADFHVYAVDWRRDHLIFLLDGQPVWAFPEPEHIPTVALPLILDLGIGGAFCGPPDASTPARAAMLIDWVRVSP